MPIPAMPPTIGPAIQARFWLGLGLGDVVLGCSGDELVLMTVTVAVWTNVVKELEADDVVDDELVDAALLDVEVSL